MAGTAQEVDWIEARSYYARLHVGARSHLVRESMHALEGRLDPATFARIHRSIIVNIDRIVELRPDAERGWVVILRDGRQLPMSRRRRRHLGFLFP
jgi:two-component system, LytTR family, response regulator